MASAPKIVVVMGVAGAGKSTVGAALAEALGCAFADADEFHPPANIAKMRAGTPLTDADRQSWLAAIAARIDEWRAAGKSGVIACSALKRAYRRIVIGDRPEVRLAYLKGDPALIRQRLKTRQHHFMPASLLDSQFETLEEPGLEERPIVVDAAQSAPDLAAEIRATLAERTSAAARRS
jgi:carbohydrate kinase (thermoresistant glucokinase family)